MKIEPWILSLLDPIFEDMQNTIDVLLVETEKLERQINNIFLTRDKQYQLRETMKNQEKIIQILTQKLDNLKLESVKVARENAIDKLTGLLLKSALIPALTFHIEEEKRKSNITSGCLLFIDVCGMNTLNDTYTHTQTDIIIQNFINNIISHLREYDFISRFGGDESVIFLQNVNVAQAIKSVIRKITTSQKRNPITAIRDSDKKEEIVTMNFYIGIEEVNLQSNDVRTEIVKALTRADKLVIMAKKARKTQNGIGTYVAYKDNGKTVIKTATQILNDI